MHRETVKKLWSVVKRVNGDIYVHWQGDMRRSSLCDTYS